MAPQKLAADWWRQATVYQIYPRSFADANGDGIGDLEGITEKVPYLAELGVDAVWLSPFYPSALKDGGYDVADYRDVDPKIGTLGDFDKMVAALKDKNIQVIVDIVPNHCSEDHVWFQEALKSPAGSEARKRFIFRDGLGPNKDQPPADWECAFGGPAWEAVGDGQWYLHIFDSSQPDWNWDHPDVIADFLKTLEFWGNRGVAGFRIDVAHAMAKDIPENGPYPSQAQLTKAQNDWWDGKRSDGPHPLWDRDEVLDIFKGWRKVFNKFDPPLTAVAECWVAPDRKHLYASSEGLGQAFSFDLLMCPYNAVEYKKTITNSLELVKGSDSSTTWVLSNHDVIRHATRFAIPESTTAMDRDEFQKYCSDFLSSRGKNTDYNIDLGLQRAKAATAMLLALPGSTYLYQGEELGLQESIDIPEDQRQDPTFFRHKGKVIGRDGCRIPIPWTSQAPSYGFSPADAKKPPHLPIPEEYAPYSVAAEDKEENSTLNFYRKALHLKKQLVGAEELEWIDNEQDVVHFKRPGGWEVLFNVSNEKGVPLPKGELLLASGPVSDTVPANTAVWVKSA